MGNVRGSLKGCLYALCVLHLIVTSAHLSAVISTTLISTYFAHWQLAFQFILSDCKLGRSFLILPAKR